MIAEGPSDHTFLGPLLHRAVDEICLREAKGSVTVSDILRIDVRQRDDEDYFQAASRVAQEHAGGYHLLFLHRDSGGAGQQARPIVIDRLCSSVAAAVPKRSCIWVVPVQETEAWALADGKTSRSCRWGHSRRRGTTPGPRGRRHVIGGRPPHPGEGRPVPGRTHRSRHRQPHRSPHPYLNHLDAPRPCAAAARPAPGFPVR
jgi:hypothetical protein